MRKTKISKEFLREAKNNFTVRFTFHILQYKGKKNSNRKAVEIELLSMENAEDVPASLEMTPPIVPAMTHQATDATDHTSSNEDQQQPGVEQTTSEPTN
jgi:hypothetical protein